MKLHLPLGLRTALAACCSAVLAIGTTLGTGATVAALAAQQVQAETISATPNKWGYYEMVGGLNYDVSNAGPWDDNGTEKNQFVLYSPESGVNVLTLGLHVDASKTATLGGIGIHESYQNANIDFTYSKLGDGILVVLAAAERGDASAAIVEDGVLDIRYGGDKAFVKDTVTVYNGAKLLLGAENAFGNSAATSLTTITLGGGTSTEDAIMEVNAATGIYNTLTIASNASISGTGVLTIHSGASINGTGKLTIGGNMVLNAVSQLSNSGGLVIADGGRVSVSSDFDNGGSFAGKNVTINAGGRLELNHSYRGADYSGIKAGDKANNVKGGTLSISTTSPGKNGDIKLDDAFYGILEIAHGGLAVTAGMSLGQAYQVNLAGVADGSGDLGDDGAYLVFGSDLTLEPTVNIVDGKYGAVTVQDGATGTISALTGSGTLVLRDYADSNAWTTFDGILQVNEASLFTGSIHVKRGQLSIADTDGLTLGSSATLKVDSLANTSLSVAGNLTLAGTDAAKTQHSLLGGVTLNEGAGTLYVKNAEVIFGGGADATNTLDVANITVQGGGKFTIHHAGNETDYADVNVTLDGGTFNVKDMSGAAAGTVLQFGTLQVNSASEIDYVKGGNMAFSSLSGAGNLKIWKGDGTGDGYTGKTTIGTLLNYAGTLNMEADATDAYKVYLNSASQGSYMDGETKKLYDATVTGKTFSSTLFTKTGDGGVTLDDHTAEAGFTVNGGKVTISNGLAVTGATQVTSGELAFNSGATFTGSDKNITVTGGKLTLGSATTLGTDYTVTLNPGDDTDKKNASTWVSGHTGAVVINSGNIAIDATNTFSSLTVNTGARVDLSGTFAGSMTLNGTDATHWYGALCMGNGSEVSGSVTVGTSGASITAWDSNTATLSGTITLNGDLLYNDATKGTDPGWKGKLNISNSISGSGNIVLGKGTMALVKKDAVKDAEGNITSPATAGTISNTGNVTIEDGATLSLAAGTSINKTSGVVEVESGGTLTVDSAASFTAQELLMSGGSATVDASMNLGKLTLSGGTLTLGAAITAQNGFTLTQTDDTSTISLSEEVVRGLTVVDNVAGTSNGWGINKYALVVPANGASFSIGENVSVSVGGNEQTLGTDGTLSLAATSGKTYYVVNSAGVYSGQGSSGINAAEKIVLVGDGLNYTATAEDKSVDIEVQGSRVISLNGTDVVLDASRVSFTDGAVARLHGSGSYVMSGTPSSSNLSFADKNGTQSEWTGTVVMENATLSGTQLDNFISKDSSGAATSTVELKNATGSLAAGTHVAHVKLSDGGVNITESKGAVELAGKVSGSGNMVISAKNADYAFSGDVSEWTGTLSNTEAAGVSKVGFTASEAASNEVNVALKGKLDVTFSGAGETMTVTSALSDYIGTTTIAGVEVMLTNPASLGQSDVQVAAHSALNLSEMATQGVTISSLALDSSATLVLGSGALEFSLEDATNSLSLNQSIPTVEGIALLSGVDSFTTIDISSWSTADAAKDELILFENVDSLANTTNTTVNLVHGDRSALYEVTLNDKGQVVAKAQGAQLIPEPATATLSLLALTALAARRRRK